MFVIVVSNKIYGKDTTTNTYSQAFRARLYEVVGLVYEMGGTGRIQHHERVKTYLFSETAIFETAVSQLQT